MLLVFDTTQVTSSGNYSNPQPGDPCHPLAAGQHPPTIILSPSAHPARTYQLPVEGQDSPAKGVDCTMRQCDLFETSDLSTSSGKTWQGHSAQITATTLRQYCKALPTSGTMRCGQSSTLNGAECRSVAVECFCSASVTESLPEPIYSRLADVLLQSVETKYNLSAKAAAGILRRAEKRGKELPPMLAAARRLGIAEDTADFVLPMAVTVFRATGPAMNLAVAIYTAHLLDIELGAAAIFAGIVVASLTTLGSASLPGSISFVSAIGPISIAMGLPVAPLAILVAVEVLPDIVRTIANVTMNVAVTGAIDRHAPAVAPDHA
mgnify:CR=1 FL=1